MHLNDGTNLDFAFKHLSEPTDKFDEVYGLMTYPLLNDNIWRDETYVENQCELLAKQLKELE